MYFFQPNITHVSARASRFSTPSVGNGHSMSDLAQKRQPFKKVSAKNSAIIAIHYDSFFASDKFIVLISRNIRGI